MLKLPTSRDIIIERDPANDNRVFIKLTAKACREKVLTQLVEGVRFDKLEQAKQMSNICNQAKSLPGRYASPLSFFGIKSSTEKLSGTFQQLKNAANPSAEKTVTGRTGWFKSLRH